MTKSEEKIRQLIDLLNSATALYDSGHTILTDEEWDEKYFELQKLEKETNIIFKDSPTQQINYSTVTALKKIKHNHPMLSLDKTKDLAEIKAFLSKKDFIAMAKMDGLTCSLTYENGKLVRAETRGNGTIGEDILHNAEVIPSIPKRINYKDQVIIDGEIICTYSDFETFSTEYKNPRNFASGSIRLLNSKECEKRKLKFIVWDIIKPFNNISNEIIVQLAKAKTLGFIICPFDFDDEIENLVEKIKKECQELSYPIDGIVFKFRDLSLREKLGYTSHHFKNAIAYKFYDEIYETRLKRISWTMGRTGVLTPVAVFDPIDMDGSIVERASLHNVSVMREILGDCAYVGEHLQVYKANMIIPQIASAGPHYDYGYVVSHGGVSANDSPEYCPICCGIVSYKDNNGVVTLECDNPYCEGKILNRLEHFASKKGLDIKGLSLATFEKLLDWKWIESLIDIFKLKEHREEWISKPGFGVASVDKILNSIEESKNTTLDAFIASLGIPLIGNTVSKELIKYFKTYDEFRNAVNDDTYHFSTIDGFGPEMDNELKYFDYSEADEIYHLLNIKIPEEKEENLKLKDLTFVITGKLKKYKNRAELVDVISQAGGKVASSVSGKTNYLINNDITSNSSKNLTAKKLGVKIITEEDFEKIF
ncbi:MAG: NAD-dependent DNA ligase LigA [Clostridia bacterium]|nr:NAD-dependent DNA ligase LigA [Clostridia bacterium]